jgi:hypothetical protein
MILPTHASRSGHPAQRLRQGTGPSSLFKKALKEGGAASAGQGAESVLELCAPGVVQALAEAGHGPGRRRRKVFEAGTRMLDMLDRLRHGLLAGDCVPPDQLRTLQASLRSGGGGGVDDEAGEGILEAIRVRVAVECARLSRPSRSGPGKG